eukprot:1160002-Pelagomonas_calceolata.AAC.1
MFALPFAMSRAVPCARGSEVRVYGKVASQGNQTPNICKTMSYEQGSTPCVRGSEVRTQGKVAPGGIK